MALQEEVQLQRQKHHQRQKQAGGCRHKRLAWRPRKGETRQRGGEQNSADAQRQIPVGLAGALPQHHGGGLTQLNAGHVGRPLLHRGESGLGSFWRHTPKKTPFSQKLNRFLRQRSLCSGASLLPH